MKTLFQILFAILICTSTGFVTSHAAQNSAKKHRKKAHMKQLTLEEARSLATRLANEAFKNKPPNSPNGPILGIKLQKESWNFREREGGRWHFSSHPPAGASANVVFDLDGSNPEVEVGYSNE